MENDDEEKVVFHRLHLMRAHTCECECICVHISGSVFDAVFTNLSLLSQQ